MPAKSLVVTDRAQKQISKLPLRIQSKVIKSLESLKNNPILGAKLGGELSSSYKLRLGDYRIIYDFHTQDSIVVILKIEHRQGVYK